MLSNMKIVFYLLIGFVLVSLVAPSVALEKVKTSESNSITATSEVKAETPKETVKDAKKTEAKEAPKPDEKPVDVVKDNPKGCDRATEWIYPDGSCHAKAVKESIATESVKPATSGGCEAVYEYSGWNQNVAYAVCMGESSGNSNAYNPEAHKDRYGRVICNGSRGLFQIACVHHDSTFDPSGNISAAVRIYNDSGWSPWGAYTSGKYLRYLR